MTLKNHMAPDFVDKVEVWEYGEGWKVNFRCDVDGEPVEEMPAAGARTIFLYEDDNGDKWVIKVDNDHLLQSRSEYLFYQDIMHSEDAANFVPTVAAGGTGYWWDETMTSGESGEAWWCVQPYIEFHTAHGSAEARSIEKYLIEVYGFKDMGMKQFKVDVDGKVWLHDYGMNEYSPDYEYY